MTTLTTEEIVKMARQAGLCGLVEGGIIDEFERFAEIVVKNAFVRPCCQQFDKCQKICMPRAAAAEREACAKLCEDKCPGQSLIYVMAMADCAEAIRARGVEAT